MEPPLPTAAFLILFALADGEKHGYAIMQQARKLSGAATSIGPATLYTNIQRLLESHYIQEVSAPAGTDSRRRYYRLTTDGTSVLTLELDRMDSLVKKAKTLRLRAAESAS